MLSHGATPSFIEFRNENDDIVASISTDGDINVAGSVKVNGNPAISTDNSTLEINEGVLRIKDAGVTSAKINSAVAGNGLAGGAGTALSVNVDDSTIEINSDSLRIKDSGITANKIAEDAVTAAKIGVLTNTTAKTSDFTLALTDKNTTILCNKTTDTAHTITIPTNDTIAFPVGTQISFVQIGSTQVVFGGAGVTLNSDNSKKKIMVRYGVASLIKTDTDTWVLFGQLTA